MKVLHIIGGGDVGGAKIHVLTLIKELEKYIPVKLISLRHGNFADEALRMGINVEVISSKNIINDICYITKLIKNEKWDIIHSHGAKANMVAVYVKKKLGTLILTTVHSDYRLDYLHNIFKMFSYGIINQIALRFMDYYIGVSGNFQKMLIDRGFPKERIFTVYNGIPFDDIIPKYPREIFEKKHNINIPEKDIVVGILARLHPVKSVDTLIKAAKIVLAKYPHVTFLVGGNGPERRKLQKLAQNLGISGKVLFLGWFEEAFEFMQNIDINVLTSVSESFPFVILEAARMKKVTVSTNVGGITDLIEDGINGYLFTPNNAALLAEKLLLLITDSVKRLEMGNQIYTKAKKYFSLENMGKNQYSIYKQIMSSYSVAPKKSKYDIILSGYYGYQNSGDDAILKAILSSLRAQKRDLRLLVLTKSPSKIKKTYMVDTIHRFNYIKILKSLKKSSLLIMGGGSLIQDVTSSRSLFYYLGIIRMAKNSRCKVMLYANGIGPLKRPSNKIRAAKSLNLVDIITLRDNFSKKYLKSLNVTSPFINITADPAFLIKPCSASHAKKILMDEGIPLKNKYVGISIRKWYKSEAYQITLAKFIDSISAKYDIIPIMIPMQKVKDINIMQQITNKMKHTAYLIQGDYLVEELMGLIGLMDIMIGMRLHSLIYAVNMGIPVIGISYEKKIDAFLDFIGQQKNIDLCKMSLSDMLDSFKEVWNLREKIKDDLLIKRKILQENALKNTQLALSLLKNNNRD